MGHLTWLSSALRLAVDSHGSSHIEDIRNHAYLLILWSASKALHWGSEPHWSLDLGGDIGVPGKVFLEFRAFPVSTVFRGSGAVSAVQRVQSSDNADNHKKESQSVCFYLYNLLFPISFGETFNAYLDPRFLWKHLASMVGKKNKNYRCGTFGAAKFKSLCDVCAVRKGDWDRTKISQFLLYFYYKTYTKVWAHR